MSKIVIGSPIDLFNQPTSKVVTMTSPRTAAPRAPNPPHPKATGPHALPTLAAPAPPLSADDESKIAAVAQAMGLDPSDLPALADSVASLFSRADGASQRAAQDDAAALRSMSSSEKIACLAANASPSNFVALRHLMGGKR